MFDDQKSPGPKEMDQHRHSCLHSSRVCSTHAIAIRAMWNQPRLLVRHRGKSDPQNRCDLILTRALMHVEFSFQVLGLVCDSDTVEGTNLAFSGLKSRTSV